jgi:DNA-binding winged helix-turn-helix (wHTH) protein
VVHYRFGPFILDVAARQLTKDGRACRLSREGIALLASLLAERPRVVSRAVLFRRVWPDDSPDESQLAEVAAEVRRALGDSDATSVGIRTESGKGYAFVGAAVTVQDPTPLLEASGIRWLEWGRQRFPLTPGVHVVGRDKDTEVRLDVTTVSRHHARLVVTPEAVVVEDLSSKNGTFRGDTRVSGAVPLMDGDAVRFGDVLVTFHAAGPPPGPRQPR